MYERCLTCIIVYRRECVCVLGYGVFVSSEVSIQLFVSGFSDFQKIKVQYSQRLPNRKLTRRSRAHDGKSFQDCETAPPLTSKIFDCTWAQAVVSMASNPQPRFLHVAESSARRHYHQRIKVIFQVFLSILMKAYVQQFYKCYKSCRLQWYNFQ